MKKLILVLAATIVAATVPALANDHPKGHDEKCVKECQMLLRNCGQEVDSIQQKISRLNAEIRKGASVYTNQELSTLERKLQEAEETLANLTTGS